MRIARITGTVVLSRRLAEVPAGRLVLAEVLDDQALRGHEARSSRATPAPESLVIFDTLGAGEGQLVAVSEGAEATVPFRPRRVPVDAYCTAILDAVDVTH